MSKTEHYRQLTPLPEIVGVFLGELRYGRTKHGLTAYQCRFGRQGGLRSVSPLRTVFGRAVRVQCGGVGQLCELIEQLDRKGQLK
jgi:hypothetical protein